VLLIRDAAVSSSNFFLWGTKLIGLGQISSIWAKLKQNLEKIEYIWENLI